MLIIYKPNLEQLILEASFAVYTFISSETTQHSHKIKIVLSAFNYEDQPIQLHIEVGSVIYGDTDAYNKTTEFAKEKLSSICDEITSAKLEVREGIFGDVHKPILGLLE